MQNTQKRKIIKYKSIYINTEYEYEKASSLIGSTGKKSQYKLLGKQNLRFKERKQK